MIHLRTGAMRLLGVTASFPNGGQLNKIGAWLSLVVLLATCGCGGGSSGGGAALSPAPGVKTITASASATQPAAGAATQVLLNITHNIHEDPSVQNPSAAFNALQELQQNDLVMASHKYIPNTSSGVWNFSGLDHEMNFLTQAGLPGTIFYNLAHCPAYLAQGGIPGAAPADNAQFALYCQRLVQYFNTTGGFSDTGTVHQRTPLNIKYWEIWGETNINEYTDDNGLPESFSNMTSAQRSMFFSTPQSFRTAYEAAVPLMKSADPTIKVGGPCVTGILDPTAANFMDPSVQAYITTLLQTSQPLDFVSYHDYANWGVTTSDQDAFAQVPELIQIAQELESQILSSPHPSAELWVTEGNGNPEADTTTPTDQRARNCFDVAYLASLVRGYALAGASGYARYDFMQPIAFNGAIYGALDDSGTRYPAFYGWKLLTTNLIRGASFRQSSLMDPQPVNGKPTVEIMAIQPAAKTLTIFVINKTAVSPADNTSQNPATQGAMITVNLTITDGTVISATLKRVDPQSGGLDTSTLSPSQTLSFQLRGYGVACVVANLQ